MIEPLTVLTLIRPVVPPTVVIPLRLSWLALVPDGAVSEPRVGTVPTSMLLASVYLKNLSVTVTLAASVPMSLAAFCKVTSSGATTLSRPPTVPVPRIGTVCVIVAAAAVGLAVLSWIAPPLPATSAAAADIDGGGDGDRASSLTIVTTAPLRRYCRQHVCPPLAVMVLARVSVPATAAVSWIKTSPPVPLRPVLRRGGNRAVILNMNAPASRVTLPPFAPPRSES